MSTLVNTPLTIVATVTTTGTLVAGAHTPVDATSGALTVNLPASPAQGAHLSVEKVDATANAVTVSGSIRSVTTTISLVLQHETLELVADAAGSWWPVAGHKTKSSLDATYARATSARSKLLPGLLVTSTNIANSANTSSYGAEGTTGYTTSQAFKTAVACTDLQLVFCGWYYATSNQAETPTAQSSQYKVAIKYNGVWYPVGFQGRRTVTVDPWATAISDPIGLDLPAGAEFQVNTFGLALSSGTTMPSGHQGGGPGIALADKWLAGDNVDSGTPSGVPISFFGPGAIVGTVLSSSKPPQVAFFVDSIGVGFGDTANINASTPGPYSWITRGINNAVPAIRLGGGGDLMANFPNLLATRRMAFASGATTAVMCQGTNDIFTTHLTLAQMQTNLTTWANMMKGRGVANLFAVTLLPRTTSTDSWATTTNQTVLAQEAVRTGYNDWLRNTAPGLLGLTCIETADTVETSRNSGKWVVNGSANYATADGIHPSSAAHTLMAAALPVSSLL